MRITVLARGWAGYSHANYRALAQRGPELQICRSHAATSVNTAFALGSVEEYAKSISWPAAGQADAAYLLKAINEFKPDVVLVQGWILRVYRQVLRRLPPETLRVLWIDSVLRSGRAKQWIGRLGSPLYIKPLFDAITVPSDRTEAFARTVLHYPPESVIRGSLSADTTTFRTEPRAGQELADRRRFLAVLRLVHHKGADVLAEAYRMYRMASDEPWSLDVVGLGPMEDRFHDLPGVTMHGFLQPTEVAELMRSSSCLINPSRIEPYGVIIHEATSCGLPVIGTAETGATPTLVADGVSGRVVPGGNVAALAKAMSKVSTQTPERLQEMSRVSQNLASRLTTESWARNMHEELEERLQQHRAVSLGGFNP